MSVDKAGVARNFGRHVEGYDRYAVVQKKMAHRLLRRVRSFAGDFRGRIVEIGCGTGYFTRLLAEAYPDAQITAIDICPEAVALAARSTAHCRHLRFRVADGEILDESGCDLLVSNATFQWFNDLAAAFRHYQACLRKGGGLIFATLGQGTFSELYASIYETFGKEAHCLAADYERHFPSPANVAEALGRAGFSVIEIEDQTEMEWHPSVKDFLYAVRGLGAGNPRPMILTPRSLARMTRFYSEHFGRAGEIKATYRIIYGRAEKQGPGASDKD